MTPLEAAITHSKTIRPRTKELYLQHIRAFLAFAGTAPRNWTARAVTSWREDMQTRKIRPQSVNVALNALRFAAQRIGRKALVEAIPRLPVKRGRTKAQEKADRPLTWQEGVQLVQVCRGLRGRDLRDTAIVTLGLRTGMLRFSMCNLTFDDLAFTERDNEHAPVRIHALTFVRRGGAPHTIELDETTAAALELWIGWLALHDVTSGPVFRSLGRQKVSLKDEIVIGAQLTPDGLYRAFQKRAADIGLPALSPHVFRRTFIAWAKEIGAKAAQIIAVTGHKSDGGDDDEDAIGDVDDMTAATINTINGDNGLSISQANMLLPVWEADFKGKTS